MPRPKRLLLVALLVCLVGSGGTVGVLNWRARRADEAAQARYRELRRGMPRSEAERLLGMTPHEPSRHATDTVATVDHDVRLGDQEWAEYSNAGQYRIVLLIDRERQTVSGKLLYRQERHLFRRMIDDLRSIW